MRHVRLKDYIILYISYELEIIFKYGDNIFVIRIVKFVSKGQILNLGFNYPHIPRVLGNSL